MSSTKNVTVNYEKMKYKISSDILNETTQCKDNYSCLTGGRVCLCEVTEYFTHRIMFVKPMNAGCSYCMSFGYSHICNCPTRKEIYYRYKK